MSAGKMRMRRLKDFLGLERNIAVMIGAGTIQSLGVALWHGYLPKVLEELGASGAMIGAYSTIGALLWIVFPYLGGILSDRLGRGRAMILSSILAFSGYIFYLLAARWWMFIPGQILTTASACFAFMGSLALTGDALPAQRRAAGIATQNILNSLPAILAPPIGGALIVWLGLLRGVRVALLVTIVLTAVAIWLQRRYYRISTPLRRATPYDVRSVWRVMRPHLKHLLIADTLVRFGTGMSGVFVVLYVLNVLGGTAVQFGLLTSVQILTTTLLVLPVSKLADRCGEASRRPYVAMAFFFYAAFPVTLVLIPSAAWLPLAFVVAGLHEVGEPARKALVVDLAQGDHSGSVIGAYHLIRGALIFPAAFCGGLLWERAPTAPFLVGAGITLLGLLWFLGRSPHRSGKP